MISRASSRVLHLRLESAEEALDRFEAAWYLETGRRPPRLEVLSLPEARALAAALRPKRRELLARLRREGPLSVRALAGRLGRDYKNVHGDVAALAGLGLVERRADGRVAVPWDVLRVELRLDGDDEPPPSGASARASAPRPRSMRSG